MKRKVGTTIDEDLYRRVKETARRQGCSVNAVLTEALQAYLHTRSSRASIVKETRGTFKVPAGALRAVLEEDLYEAR